MKPLNFVVGLAALLFVGQATQASDHNQLTPLERTEGWKLLFDGKTTRGWRSFKKETFPATGWVVEDGWLKCVAGARGGNIISIEQFTDFELRWEWRIPPKANSGVKYFITEDRAQAIGHEYQMLDNPNARPKHRTAAFYDVLPPASHPLIRLAPDCNESRLVVRGNHVEHWLNGEKVIAYECGSKSLADAVANSKFKSEAGFGNKVRGHILLTDHRDEAWFRNIKIRPLSPADVN